MSAAAFKLREWARGLEAAGQASRAKMLDELASSIEAELKTAETSFLGPVAEVLGCEAETFAAVRAARDLKSRSDNDLATKDAMVRSTHLLQAQIDEERAQVKATINQLRELLDAMDGRR